MHWFMGVEDREERHRREQDQAVLHERRWMEDQKVSWIETTPPGQPIPTHSMAQYREDQQAKMDRAILDVMGNEPDDIPM